MGDSQDIRFIGGLSVYIHFTFGEFIGFQFCSLWYAIFGWILSEGFFLEVFL